MELTFSSPCGLFPMELTFSSPYRGQFSRHGFILPWGGLYGVFSFLMDGSRVFAAMSPMWPDEKNFADLLKVSIIWKKREPIKSLGGNPYGLKIMAWGKLKRFPGEKYLVSGLSSAYPGRMGREVFLAKGKRKFVRVQRRRANISLKKLVREESCAFSSRTGPCFFTKFDYVIVNLARLTSPILPGSIFHGERCRKQVVSVVLMEEQFPLLTPSTSILMIQENIC